MGADGEELEGLDVSGLPGLEGLDVSGLLGDIPGLDDVYPGGEGEELPGDQVSLKDLIL